MPGTANGCQALLIIDMIHPLDFPQAESLAPSVLAAARCIVRLRRAFHRRDLPVIYANDNFANWKSDFRELVARCAGAGGTAQQVAELVRPGAEDYFVLKPKHSAFLATALPVLLAKLGVGSLYLTGMTAESCVLTTALDANTREYRVRVVRDAVAGSVDGMRAAFAVLEASKAAGVVSSRSAMAALRP